MRPATRAARTARASRCGCGPRPSSRVRRGTGDYVKQALEEVGIAVEIVPADSAPRHIEAVYTDHDFDLAINSPAYRTDPAISTTILYQGGLEPGIPFSNQCGYDNPELNQVIADGRTTVDTEARVELYNEFQRIIADELPTHQPRRLHVHARRQRPGPERRQQSRAGRSPAGRTSGSPASDLSAPVRAGARSRSIRSGHASSCDRTDASATFASSSAG